MPTDRNDVEGTEILIRSSVTLPRWMAVRLDAVARRTLSSRSQVIRRMVAEALEREPSEAVA